jgi:hypothetical protein
MKKPVAYKKLFLDDLNGDELRLAQEDIRRKLEKLENKEYYENVVCKFKEKYEGKWVKLKGSFSGSYDGDTGFRLVKIKKVFNAYHQDDPILWEFDVEPAVEMLLNLKNPNISIYHSDSFNISEKEEKPQILTKEQVIEYKNKAVKLLQQRFDKVGL